jgi:V/A-type H+-transporting ATPase subunit E
MALEDILRKIGDDAEAEADSLFLIAQAEADGIREKALRQADELRSELLEKAKSRAKGHADRVETLAALDVRKDILKQKKSLIEECFVMAENSIRSLSPEEYLAFLEPLLVEAVESGEEEIIPSSAHKSILSSAFLDSLNAKLGPQKGRLRLSNESGDFSGGFILRDGRKETNLTLKSLIASKRDGLEPQIARILFGEDA